MDDRNPLNDWRSLLTRIGVVVVGVLIALGAVQAVEALYAQHQATLAAKRIEPELRANMEFLAERMLVARCIGARLDALEARLLAANGRWTPVAPGAAAGAGNILPVPLREWESTAWTTALADASADRLEARAFYARLYHAFDAAAGQNEAEYETAARLNVLTKPVTLSSDQVVQLVELIESERARNRMFARDAIGALQVWRQAGRDTAELMKAVRQSSPAVKVCGDGEAPRQGLPRSRAMPFSLPKP